MPAAAGLEDAPEEAAAIEACAAPLTAGGYTASGVDDIAPVVALIALLEEWGMGLMLELRPVVAPAGLILALGIVAGPPVLVAAAVLATAAVGVYRDSTISHCCRCSASPPITIPEPLPPPAAAVPDSTVV